jgi:hypothetical protein
MDFKFSILASEFRVRRRQISTLTLEIRFDTMLFAVEIFDPTIKTEIEIPTEFYKFVLKFQQYYRAPFQTEF